MNRFSTALLCLAMLWQTSKAQKKESTVSKFPYQNSALPIAERVNDLLARMTLEEKIGQMTQIATTEINTAKDPKNKGEKFQPFLDKEKAAKLIKEQHIGSFLAAFAVTPKEWYEFSLELQKTALANSRLGIPIIYGNDHVHGANYITDATVFPQPFNLSNTFNDQFSTEMGRITAREIADLGQHWNFAPILDIGRNPYWPRQYETFGEAPLVCTRMGVAYIKALQEEKSVLPQKVAATAKHFLGYSDPKSGWDRVPSVISEQELREVFLPPFREAIQAGVKTFMINSGELNGVPVHASKKILNDLLRKELGFQGVIVSDWADILQLIGQHKVAHNEKEATKMALEAGIDMSMTATSTTFCTVTKDLVQEGLLSESVINDATRRILTLKFDLGLFENPFPRADRLNRIGSKEHLDVALNSARESIVLLKNDGVLPLSPNLKKILLAGPSIDSKRNICGGWTIEWGGAPESSFPSRQQTVYSGLKKLLPQVQLDTVRDANGKLAAQASGADVIILAVGEEPYAEGNGNIDDLNLPTEQQNLIAEATKTGKPVVLIMLAGRPRLPGIAAKDCKAFIFAGLPGFEGGQALAEIITGKVNPSGKLSFTYPASPGHINPHNCKAHDKPSAAFPFGHGLSYATFKYSNLTLSDTLLHQNQTITAKVTVSNEGKISGKEAVLWFLKDEVRSITPTLHELAEYEKILLKAGESRTLDFRIIPGQHLSFPDEKGNILMENGYHEVQVGNLKKKFYFQPFGQTTQKTSGKNEKYLQQDLLEP